MLSGTGYRYTVQKFKKIKIKRPQQRIRRARFGRQFAPRIVCCLRLTEDFVNAFCCCKFFIDLLGIALISKSELIFQVDKLVIDRRCREHQDFCSHTRSDNSVHKFQITVFLCVLSRNFAAVAKIMAFINHNKIVISPVQAVEVDTVRLPMFAR